MARKFTLPNGWYRETTTRLIEETLPPLLGELTPSTAWRYVYAISLWHQESDGQDYLHLVESSELKKAAGKAMSDRAAEYLTDELVDRDQCDPFQIINHIGKEYNLERARQGHPPSDKRDPNMTGTSFETVLEALIEKLCGTRPRRTPNLHSLQGFEFAPVGYHSRPDLVLFTPRDFRLLISTKWTLRKERIGTYLHESYFYRKRRPDLQIAFVVNEFQHNILHHLTSDALVDRVYHVNKRMLLEVQSPFTTWESKNHISPREILGATPQAKRNRDWISLSDRLFDLSELFEHISKLNASPDGEASGH